MFILDEHGRPLNTTRVQDPFDPTEPIAVFETVGIPLWRFEELERMNRERIFTGFVGRWTGPGSQCSDGHTLSGKPQDVFRRDR